MSALMCGHEHHGRAPRDRTIHGCLKGRYFSIALASRSSGSDSRWSLSSRAQAGTHTPQQYRETAEYGSRASLSLARDDSGTMVLKHVVPVPAGVYHRAGLPGPVGEDRLQRGPIRRSNIEKLRNMDPGLALARPGRQHINTSSPRRRGPIRRSNIEKLRSMDPGPRSRSPGTTAHQHVVPAKAGTHTPQQYRETAEYGSRASLTLARDDSGTSIPAMTV